MMLPVLGFSVLLAKLFPVGGQLLIMLLGGMYGPVFGKLPPALFHAFVLLANYVPAVIVATIFVNKAQLSERLPKEMPGSSTLLYGLALLVIYHGLRIFASTVPGGGAPFVVSIYSPFLIIPSNILVVIGVTKVLLAALPRLRVRESMPEEKGSSRLWWTAGSADQRRG
ncbi:MAG TPA: hypothetical protein PK620_07780 [Denitromonas sp.]|uniref:hypothetical protein n=1 Tax=Denitromonas sp. TaxID=2734609 RepID=UPI001D59DF84|nr:hypothetical protein [Rhodocyclaceae bacterium]MCP5222446.1 hypothetical protein [Zoogloeaceae bacterium]HQV14802.1 hypothetical protein [Denitromonas sp.]